MLGDKTVSIFPRSAPEVLNKEPKNVSGDSKVTPPPPVQRRDMGGRRCRVVFSYSPQHDDELPLCVGQTITILQEVEEGWWKGILDGQIGMFPSNFVEEDTAEASEAPGKNPEPSVESINNINNQLNVNGQNREIKPKPIQGLGYGVKLTDLKKEVRRDTDQAHSPPTATTNGSAKILGSSTASAFHPIHKDTPKENGQVKNFRDLPHKLPPALEPKTDKVTSKTDKTRINAADKERINSLEKDRISGGSNQEDKPKVDGVNKREQPLPAAPTALPPTAPQTQLPPPQLPPKPVREMARVMFPYSAEHEDELELHESDLITILCKDLEDRGWWRGELNGRVGVFPDNFVELVTIEELTKPPRPEKPAAVLAKRSPTSSTDSTPTSTLNKNDKEPPPPLPEKKVPAPPPPEKKPPPPDIIATDDTPTMNIFSKKNSNSHARVVATESDDTSLSLDTEGEKLRHVTHLRPKGPSRRRPPSGVFKENMKNPNTAESDLPPTPEDEVDHDGGNNSREELPRSPSVPVLSHEPYPSAAPRMPEMRGRPEPNPRPETSPTTAPNTVPWLQELGLKQKQKRLSGIHSQDGDTGGAPAPPVSPKPSLNTPPRPDDKPAPKNVRAGPDAAMALDLNSTKSRPTELMQGTVIRPVDAPQPTKTSHPRLPTPDYEHKPFAPQPPSTKTKPQPAPASHHAQAPVEGKRYLPQVTVRQPSPSPQPSSSPDTNKKPSPVPLESKDNNIKLPPTPDMSTQVEEKINALSKDFIQKIKYLEEKMEEQRRDQMRQIKMLMTDLDDERKKRACMEVEMERLKKLVDAYAQV
ncbi:hypothetical protein Pmani_007228 [Petrolisthes manimaculis]|uniref:SH3 domain-containing protein n=1 Tax=Petrolisthes manimaculis TaxID=1843537 RepID=A0AAE1UIX3_9EUCA|nr:hypothetical protein Pmani_007228 [Petrolisthes manimaculis]